MTEEFIQKTKTNEDFWRSIILYGQNTASYKFALAKALLDIKPASNELIPLTELALPFSKHICEHLRQQPIQGTFPSSKFISGCKQFNEGVISETELVEHTLKLGFKNVIDAFHIVNTDPIAKRFFLDERESNNAIRLTDNFFALSNGAQKWNLIQEVEGRWRLVETAWELKLSRNVLAISYDKQTANLQYIKNNSRRQDVTKCQKALNGYQKGFCFYCFSEISLQELTRNNYPEVDHFFPHCLKSKRGIHPSGIDGVWNLVLACKNCNRGATTGKFAKLPSLRLLERLSTRNEFLIASHHPLRETLKMQTGATKQERRSYLQKFWHEASHVLHHEWEPELVSTPKF